MTKAQIAIIVGYVVIFFACVTIGFVLKARSDDEDPELVAMMVDVGFLWPAILFFGVIVGIVGGIPYGLSKLVLRAWPKRDNPQKSFPTEMPDIYSEVTTKPLPEGYQWMQGPQG